MVEVTQKSYYALYDFLLPEPIADDSRSSANFDSLTGGEMTISNISYTIVDINGQAVKKYMPGATTYSPVSLLRAMDNGSKAMYDLFKRLSEGDLSGRNNYSVVMIDSQGKAQAMWHLINATPIKIDGFSFNQYLGEAGINYVDFTLTLQPEEIHLVFS